MESMNRYGGPAPGDHLVKHDNPLVMTQRFKPASPKKRAQKANEAIEGEDLSIVLPDAPRADKKEPKNPNIVDITSAEDILDYILPPRLWSDHGNQYTQKVSRIPATRMDILSLQERLDVRLEQQKARETGICPIRRELYAQAFDELIRQATLECAERGLMLLRVRDEIRMTVATYETLFESSMAYGMRKVLLSEQGKNECHSQISDLSAKNVDLQRLVNDWMAKFDELEAKNQELRRIDHERKQDELAVVLRTNNQLATVLNNIIVKRTLVFNTGSGLSDLAPAKDAPPVTATKSEETTAAKTKVKAS
ncbi:33 kDa inner dynein arm light chain, axonemal [Hypsibius exemplaris]|uniref:33 kDa inner dynein arm light chain, axonemal n=1 Tax=Hypsibius exemplaris TaxID=2072580 RepID=A0A1W0XCD6_HYPEX|nr:33 kDa inner dynein arm light chain, axonemal [Hypsibius exemplaris]